MRALFYGCAVAAICGLGTQISAAADYGVDVNGPSSGMAGELSVWGQGVLPTNGLDDGDSCNAGGTEFCGNVLGAGGYAGIEFPVLNGWSLIGDVTFDYHEETNSDPDDRDRAATYAALGAHLVNNSGPVSWGVFGLVAGGDRHAETGNYNTVWGFGAEARRDNLFAQGGYLFNTEDKDGTIDSLYFVRGGGEYEFANGMIEASALLGWGDFDGSSGGGSDDDESWWTQLALQYEAPIVQTGMNWFVGYQGDWLHVDERCCGGDLEHVFLHTVKVGLTIPLGGGALSFKTPNFRAPLSNADELN